MFKLNEQDANLMEQKAAFYDEHPSFLSSENFFESSAFPSGRTFFGKISIEDEIYAYDARKKRRIIREQLMIMTRR